MSDGAEAQELPAAEKTRGVVANSLWMLLSQAISIAVSGGIAIYAIRSIEPSHWGQYSTAFALIAIFTVFSALGISQLALREMSMRPAERQDVFAQALTATLVTTGISLVGLAATASLLGYPRRLLVLLAILSPILLIEPFLGLCQAAFNAARQLVFATVFQVGRSLTYASLAVVLLVLHEDVVGLALASLGGGLAALALSLVLLRRKLHLRPSVVSGGIRHFLVAAVPIAGISVVGILYDRIDILMLSTLTGPRHVAHYAVPYNWVRLSWVVPSVISAAFFPVLAQTLASRRDEARAQFLLVVRVFLFLSMPLSLLLAVGSPVLIEGVFGHAYAPSVSVLEIMAWTSVLGFENYALWYGILAIRRERLVLVIQIAGLIVNVAANAILIPTHGPDGAAVALLLSDLLVVAGQTVVVHRQLFRLPFRRLLGKPAAATVVAVPAAVLLARVEPMLGAAVGAVLYVAALLATAYITPDEWRPLTSAALRFGARLRRRQPSPA